MAQHIYCKLKCAQAAIVRCLRIPVYCSELGLLEELYLLLVLDFLTLEFVKLKLTSQEKRADYC